ncbi:hypothetical protein OFN51_35470, partial [Escherichia coli]|nr:hypothetical protein [Escherichia coli]
MTSAKIKDINATRTKVQANIAELRSLEAKQAAQVRELATLKESNRLKFVASGGEKRLAASRA